TAARRAALTGSPGEVVPQAHGPVEVDVAELGAGALGREVHHDPHAPRRGPDDVQLPGADERHVAQPDLAGAGGREGAVQVVGGREQDADDVVVVDAVAAAHLLEQLDGPLVDVRLLVDVDGGGSTEGSEGDRHGR